MQRLPTGRPVAIEALARLRAATSHCLVVLRPEDAELERLATDLGASIVHCHDAANGMGASLACAIRSSSTVDGWVIALADMPFVLVETMRSIVDELERGAQIVAPRYRGQRGHPIGFSKRHYRSLSVLDGDEGARQLFLASREEVSWLEVSDPGILRDIDQPDDLLRNE